MSDAKPVELCRLEDLEVNAAKRFDIEDHRLSVIRLGEDVFVIGDECTHADFSLSDGDVDASERTIECPKHGALFSIDDGEPGCLPATKAVPTYSAKVEDGMVKVVLS